MRARWLLAALLWTSTGLLRAFAGFEKGSEPRRWRAASGDRVTGADMRHRLRGVALSLALLLPAPVSAAQESPGDRILGTVSTRIEGLVAPQAEADLVSGVILVARGGEVLFERVYGFANWELGAPVSPSSRFGIASITKPLTEILVRMLAAEGRIDLEAPVERYLPGFPRGAHPRSRTSSRTGRASRTG